MSVFRVQFISRQMLSDVTVHVPSQGALPITTYHAFFPPPCRPVPTREQTEMSKDVIKRLVSATAPCGVASPAAGWAARDGMTEFP
jgi:hypothetical protein